MKHPMPNSAHTIRQELHGILLFVGIIWAVFLLSCVFPRIDDYGVVPRTTVGLIGIPASPFLHANVHHLLGNTIPLLVLLALLAGSQARSWMIVLEVALLGGLLLWLFGRGIAHVGPVTRPITHIGASGLIFGLAAFLIVSGFLERRLLALLVAVVVGFLYGSTLLWGVLPSVGPEISWDGHLTGAVAGAAVAYALTRKPVPEEGSKAV
jgi:membrane associated rhomboid family serine protease